jgi:putative oxidoreductase
MNRIGVPTPELAAFVATWVEIVFPIAIVIGWSTRRIALLLAIYTFATAMIGHRFWGVTGLAGEMEEIQFFKNLCIVAGFMLLYQTGPGEYSIDTKLDKVRAAKRNTPG